MHKQSAVTNPAKLFVYGTLQDERVMRAVTGKVFSLLPANLRDYQRFQVKDADYPGIRAVAGASVQGMIALDVDADSLRALDEFEGEYYVRNATRVVDGNGQLHECFVYVIVPEWLHLLTLQPWSLEEFQRVGYERFRATYPNF